MTKVIKLKESDIQRIVKRVITENYGYDEYIPNIQLGDTFRDTFNGDIFRVTDIQQNNPDGEGEDYETWVELENQGGEVVSFPHHYERGVRFNDVFTKVYLKPKYNYPPLDDIQLNEQEENEFCSKFPNSVYGEGESSNLSMSQDKSLHNATVNLSKKLNKSSVTTKIVEEKTFMRGSNYVTKVCVEEDV